MATLRTRMFDRKALEDAAPVAPYAGRMINLSMGRREWLILLFLALIWGGAFFFIGVAVRSVEPFTYVWLRMSIAAVALWAWLWASGKRPTIPQGAIAALLILALLNNVVPFILFGWGQTHIASGLASILNATTPLWGVIVAHFATRDEPLTPAKLSGVLIGVAGVAVMIGPQLLADVGTNALAQIACIAASFSYAVAGVWARRFKGMGLSPVNVTAWQLLLGALVMIPVAGFIDQPWNDAPPPLTAIAAITALALLCTSFAYVLYFKLIDSSGATNALLVTLLVPPVAILLGALFLGEMLAPVDFIGLGLIAIGLAAIDGRLFTRVRRASPLA